MYRIILFLVAFTITSYAQQFLLPNSIQWWHLTQASKDSLVVNAEAASADTIRNISSIVIKDSMDFDWLENSLNARKNLSPDSMGAATTTALADTADSLRDYIDNISLDSVNVDSAEITTWHIKNGTILDEDVSTGTLNNDKLQHYSVGVTAGNGLSGGSASINLGASVSLIANVKNELQIKGDTIVFDTTMARTTILADDVIEAKHIKSGSGELAGLTIVSDTEWGVDAGDGLETGQGEDLDVLAGYGVQISTDSVAINYTELEDTVITTIKDTVEGADLSPTGDWTIGGTWDFSSRNLVDADISNSITASNYVLKTAFVDSFDNQPLVTNFSDSVKSVTNDYRRVIFCAPIDSSEIYVDNRIVLYYCPAQFIVDTLVVVGDDNTLTSTDLYVNIHYGASISATGDSLFGSAQQVTSTGGGHKYATPDPLIINPGDWIWVEIRTLTSKPEQLVIALIGKESR